MTSQEKALRDFAQFAAKLKGDEKSEAQTFLFHLLAAFGHDPNTLPEGSTFEYRVRSSVAQVSQPAVSRVSKPADLATSDALPTGKSAIQQVGKPALRWRAEGQRTQFADFVWPGRCLIEMKSRGVKLSSRDVQSPLAAPPANPKSAIPKGLNHSARGCEARATLGNRPERTPNPEWVASPPLSSAATTTAPPIPDSALRTPSTLRSTATEDGHSALAKVRAVANAAVSLRALRREIMQSNGWSLRDLYRTLETPGANRLRDAHAALDSAVRAPYGMNEGEGIVDSLLRLNPDLADKEAKGESITPPGLPAVIAGTAEFISPDCIRAPGLDASHY